MPTYEYECNCCSFRFELKQSFNENTPVSCPRCQGGARRIFSPVPIIFKGSGFYSTDSRKNHGHPSQQDSTEGAKTDGTDETKTGSTEGAKTGSTEGTKAASTERTKPGNIEGK
ncbi:MAG: FmdB family transcriptional regulator [Chloroflexi bacterium]|nr:FmdB family transcriptional regulator [Chloroflexota bacterium]